MSRNFFQELYPGTSPKWLLPPTATQQQKMPKQSYKRQYLLRMEESILLLLLLRIYMERRHRSRRLLQGGGRAILLREILKHPCLLGALHQFCATSRKCYILSRSCRRRPFDKFTIDIRDTPVDPQEKQPWLNDTEFLLVIG